MPKKGSHRHKIVAEGEVTIKDFADKKTQGGRPKKIFNKNIDPNNALVTENIIDEIVSLDIDDDETASDNKKKRKNKKHIDPNHVYNDFHIDIWFLISEHIRPEDTGRFALICKKTEAVVCSARYWSNLYKKFYHPKFSLPERLEPNQMERVGGLRARVICSLFYICPTFSLRLSKPNRNNLNSLQNMQCIEMWYRSVREDVWMFIFRFFNQINVRKPLALKRFDNSDWKNDCNAEEDDVDILDRLEDFLAQHNNLFENPHEGQHLLVVTTDRFIPFPAIRNYEGGESDKIKLEMIRQPLSKDMRNSGLEMSFINYRKTLVARVFYEKILNFSTIHWWDPEFRIFLNCNK